MVAASVPQMELSLPKPRKRDTLRIKTNSRIVDIPVDSKEAMARIPLGKWLEMAKNAFEFRSAELLCKAVNGIMMTAPPGDDEWAMKSWKAVVYYLKVLQKMHKEAKAA